jgi:hypothetical protein
MIKRGFCVRSSHAPRHIHVVLNDPGPDGEILFVNFTTRHLPRDAKEEVFTKADYVLLTQPSVIAFWGAHPSASAQPLEAAIRKDDFSILPEIPLQTLQRMIAAARTSRHLSPAQKRLLP